MCNEKNNLETNAMLYIFTFLIYYVITIIVLSKNADEWFVGLN